jgi:cell division protease FtsH
MITKEEPKQPEEVSFSKFEKLISEQEVETIRINNADFSVYGGEGEEPKDFRTGYPGSAGSESLVQLAKKNDVQVYSTPIPEEKVSLISRILNNLFPALLIAILIFIALRMGLINSKFAEVSEPHGEISFNDVAGCDEAIEEISEIKEFLANPAKFTRLGARPPKGVLLYGPPGTGKTLLAKALAAEADVPFFSVSGSGFIEIFAGTGSMRVRELFEKANKVAPAIIFVDELDAIGGHRSSGGGGDGATRESDQTLNQFLACMDGFDVNEHPVIVVGATNRKESLDTALIRPGRFDRHISVDPPDRKGREQILKIHSRDIPLEENINLDRIALHTSGMTGADLELIINEATVIATRRNADKISMQDLDDAYMRVVAGAEKKNRVMSAKERKRVAVHEAGHAIVKEKLGGSEIVHKISIIPRGNSGGQTVSVSQEDVFLHSPDDLLDMVCGLLAGRAAEETLLNSISSGAQDDLQRANKIVDQMIKQLGMGETLGLMVEISDNPNNISGSVKQEINKEIKDLLEQQYLKAKQIVESEKVTLEKITETLLQNEIIDRDEFLEIYNQNTKHDKNTSHA